MMRGGGGMGMGRPSWRRDQTVLNQELTPGILKRVLALALEYKGMLALFLCLVTVDAVLGTLNPLILRDIINNGIGGHNSQLVIELALLAAGIATLDMLVTLVERYVSARIGESLIFDLRRRVFGHVQRMPLAFFTRTQTGALVSRLNNDIIGAQQAFTNTLGSVVSNIITVSIVVVAMLALSWQITLASLALLPLFVIPARLVGKKLQAITRERYMVSAEMNNTMTERFNVAGALLVKLFGTPELEQTEFENHAARVRDLGVTASMYNGVFYSSMFLLTSLATALIYGWGGVLTVNGVLDIGTIVALTAYLQRLYGPLNQLSSVQIDVMTALVSFDRVFEVLDLEPMIDDKPGAVDVPPRAGADRSSTTSTSATRERTRSRSRRSSRSPCSTRRPTTKVLFDVSFTIEPGELVALVGHSGAGKTTISNLVPRLYDVRVGRDPHQRCRRARRHARRRCAETIGVVTQDAHLFHDTIRANLEFARPEATEAEMREALERGTDPAARRRPPRRSRYRRRRSRLPVLGRREAAHRDRAACSSRRRGSWCSTRPPLISIPSRKSRVQAALETALERPNVDRDRTPPLDRAPRRQDPRGIDEGGIVEQGTHDDLLAAGWRLRRPLRDAVQAAGHDGRAQRYAVSAGTRHGVMPCSRATACDRSTSARALFAYEIAARRSPSRRARRIWSSSSSVWSTSAIQILAVCS